jgi:hypothetical protein
MITTQTDDATLKILQTQIIKTNKLRNGKGRVNLKSVTNSLKKFCKAQISVKLEQYRNIGLLNSKGTQKGWKIYK